MKFFLVLLSIQLVYGAFDVPPPHQNAYQYTCLSWNMLGTQSTDYNKWTHLANFLDQGIPHPDSHPFYEIVALQESAMIPDNMIATQHTFTDKETGQRKTVEYVPLASRMYETDIKPFLTELPRKVSNDNASPWTRRNGDVREYEWRFGNKLYYVYHVTCHYEGNNRISMAIASLYRADEVFIYRGSRLFNKPVLGIKIGHSFFFSIENVLGSPYLLYNMVSDIEANFCALETRSPYPASWVIMGTSPERMSVISCRRSDYTRQLFYRKVDLLNNVYAFAVIGDKKLISQRLMNIDNTLIPVATNHHPIFISPIPKEE